MPRRPLPIAIKGSQKWTQQLVNQQPSVLDAAIGHGPIQWLSPLTNDEHAEYWDDSFLSRLSLVLPDRSLRSFWPLSGPRWDALGRIRGGAAVMVEAKAHITELKSRCFAGSRSRQQIESAFAEVGKGWRIANTSGWCDEYYQYANRLAHAFLLNELNPTPAFVVFIYFIGDAAMNGPRSRQEWERQITQVHQSLGVEDRLPPYVLDAFVDVSGPVPVAV